MRRFGLLGRVSVPLVLVGALLLPGHVAPAPAVAATPCPTGPVTIDDLIRLAEDRGPILEERSGLDAISVSGHAAACFGSRKLRVTAFVANGIIGDITPWSLKPTWMVAPGLFLFGARRLENHGEYGVGPFLMAATPPSLGDVQARYRNRWVVVTGRYDDPVAASCRPTGLVRVAPSRREARQICRGIFVVSSVELLGAPSTTTADAPAAAEAPPAATKPCGDGGEVTLADLLYTTGDYAGPLTNEFGLGMAPMLMSDLALDCFGDRTLRFTAWVRDPGVVGWESLFGLEPVWFRSAKTGLFVSVAAEPPPGVTPLVALAVPPALGDLQAKHVGRWVTVTGHFDDPAAAACTAEGVAGHTPSATEAVTICRATFVVEGVARTSPPGTATDPSAPPVEPADVGGWLALSAALGALLVAWLRERLHHA